ncbi:unnamed protein product [Paramecium octaurelia]|uniref:Uncharacterized protein n=1 Tax=Paramecium octaurelia TaxID=43137 RepID=A0A8S1U885_PAROT|nr:unnamed protein product [Paramecium octaurelia]
MKKNAPNISKVASDLILAYQQLTSQQKEITISPRYEKTALYFPQSRTHIIMYIMQLLKSKLKKKIKLIVPEKPLQKRKRIVYQRFLNQEKQQIKNEIHEHTRKIFVIAIVNHQLKYNLLCPEQETKKIGGHNLILIRFLKAIVWKNQMSVYNLSSPLFLLHNPIHLLVYSKSNVFI